jgi:xanthine dehydrogenase accessory factor
MINIFAEIEKLLASGRKVGLARIIRQSGSAPRGVGTGFLVMDDGSFVGTIGGGYLEHQVLEAVKQNFGSGRSVLIQYRLTGKEVAKTDMLCGGIVDVFVEFLFPECEGVQEFFKQVHEQVRQHRQAVLLTRVEEGVDPCGKGGRALLWADGTTAGALENVDLIPQRWKQTGRPTLFEPDPHLHRPAVFVEPLEPDAVLYLFGAGHVSTFVAPLAQMVGFWVVVIDDRKEFANTERFPHTDEIIVCPFIEAFEKISVTNSSFITIITRGHIHDRDVLRAALHTPAGYVGMIGSRRKRDLIFQSLVQEGIAAEELQRVHTPIGLEIGAETPEEIAVSIVAELIRIRAQRIGAHL